MNHVRIIRVNIRALVVMKYRVCESPGVGSRRSKERDSVGKMRAQRVKESVRLVLPPRPSPFLPPPTSLSIDPPPCAAKHGMLCTTSAVVWALVSPCCPKIKGHITEQKKLFITIVGRWHTVFKLHYQLC